MAIKDNRSNLEFIQWGYHVYNDVPISTPVVFTDIDTRLFNNGITLCPVINYKSFGSPVGVTITSFEQSENAGGPYTSIPDDNLIYDGPAPFRNTLPIIGIPLKTTGIFGNARFLQITMSLNVPVSASNFVAVGLWGIMGIEIKPYDNNQYY